MGLQLVSLCDADGGARSRPARARLRLVRLPLARHRRLSLDHHAGDDLRSVQGVLPQRFRLRRQQRPDRFQGSARLLASGRLDEGRAVLGQRDRAHPCLRGLARDHRLEIWQGADGRARRGEPHALPRLSGRELQAVRLRRFGNHRGHRRRALCAAGRHHQSERIRARELDRSGDLGRGRRPRHADRRGDRRHRGQLRQDLFHRRLPRILALRPRPPVRPDHAVPAQGHPGAGAQERRERPQPREVVPPPRSIEEGVEP